MAPLRHSGSLAGGQGDHRRAIEDAGSKGQAGRLFGKGGERASPDSIQRRKSSGLANEGIRASLLLKLSSRLNALGSDDSSAPVVSSPRNAPWKRERNREKQEEKQRHLASLSSQPLCFFSSRRRKKKKEKLDLNKLFLQKLSLHSGTTTSRSDLSHSLNPPLSISTLTFPSLPQIPARISS